LPLPVPAVLTLTVEFAVDDALFVLYKAILGLDVMAGVPNIFPFSMCKDVPGVGVPMPSFPSEVKNILFVPLVPKAINPVEN
jgi:hypothetical protein